MPILALRQVRLNAQLRIPQYDEMREKILRFEKHWNPFCREFFGCPETGMTTVESCINTQRVDYEQYFKAKKAAMKLFDLVEKKT